MPEGRLTSERSSSSSESRNVRDALNGQETGTKRDGLTCSNSSRSYSVSDDASSVSEFMYGSIS